MRKQTGSHYISFGEFLKEIKDAEVIIPLMQRNYKWNVTAVNASAEKNKAKKALPRSFLTTSKSSPKS